MASTKPTANWQQIDIDTLPIDCRKAYDAYKAQYSIMKEAKATFEAMMVSTASPPKGKTLIFGYNFGKLSAALVDIVEKAKPASSAMSLTNLIKRG